MKTLRKAAIRALRTLEDLRQTGQSVPNLRSIESDLRKALENEPTCRDEKNKGWHRQLVEMAKARGLSSEDAMDLAGYVAEIKQREYLAGYNNGCDKAHRMLESNDPDS